MLLRTVLLIIIFFLTLQVSSICFWCDFQPILLLAPPPPFPCLAQVPDQETFDVVLVTNSRQH